MLRPLIHFALTCLSAAVALATMGISVGLPIGDAVQLPNWITGATGTIAAFNGYITFYKTVEFINSARHD